MGARGSAAIQPPAQGPSGALAAAAVSEKGSGDCCPLKPENHCVTPEITGGEPTVQIISLSFSPLA